MTDHKRQPQRIAGRGFSATTDPLIAELQGAVRELAQQVAASQPDAADVANPGSTVTVEILTRAGRDGRGTKLYTRRLTLPADSTDLSGEIPAGEVKAAASAQGGVGGTSSQVDMVILDAIAIQCGFPVAGT
jgi:hypothetical protein